MSAIIYLTECPRDAIQGVVNFIPTERKIQLLNSLLNVGFDVLDAGSFVSPKIIPQMADTDEVLRNVERKNSSTKISVIVASLNGAKRAAEHPNVDILGFPLSISEVFQLKNTHKTIQESLKEIERIFYVCKANDKELMVYLSMAFGNPYGEKWSAELVSDYTNKLLYKGILNINISDTTNEANEEKIESIYKHIEPVFEPKIFGMHLHTAYNHWREKIALAYELGWRKFDSAIIGLGGCPLTGTDKIGNMPTEKLITFAKEKNALSTNFNPLAFEAAYNEVLKIKSDFF